MICACMAVSVRELCTVVREWACCITFLFYFKYISKQVWKFQEKKLKKTTNSILPTYPNFFQGVT